METQRRECFACRKTYDSALAACPYCGCPQDYVSRKKPEFPASLREHFQILSWEDGFLDDREDLRIWRVRDRKSGRVCRMRILQEDAGTDRFLEKLSALRDGRPYQTAEIYEIVRGSPGACSWYSFENVDDLSILDMLERENPVGEEQAQMIFESMQSVWRNLRPYGFEHGSLDLSSFALRGSEVILRDYGDGILRESDRVRIEEIYQRIRKGYWIRSRPETPEDEKRRGGFFGKLFRRKG